MAIQQLSICLRESVGLKKSAVMGKKQVQGPSAFEGDLDNVGALLLHLDNDNSHYGTASVETSEDVLDLTRTDEDESQGDDMNADTEPTSRTSPFDNGSEVADAINNADEPVTLPDATVQDIPDFSDKVDPTRDCKHFFTVEFGGGKVKCKVAKCG